MKKLILTISLSLVVTLSFCQKQPYKEYNKSRTKLFFVYDSIPIRETIAYTLAQKGYHAIFAMNKIPTFTFSGRLPAYLPIDSLIRSLRLITKLNFTIKGKDIIVQ